MKSSLKIRFIVDPKAGGDKTAEVASAVKEVFASYDGFFEIRSAKESKDGERLAEEAARKGFTGVVACGGDALIKEVAASLLKTGILFGIVPLGEANVVAGGFSIPLDVVSALKVVAAGRTKMIDVGRISMRLFLTSAGIGFDVVLAKNFLKWADRKRRSKQYLSKELLAFKRFKVNPLVIKGRNEEFSHISPMLVRFANVESYGAEGAETPVIKGASPADGLLNVAIVPPIDFKEAVKTMPLLLDARFDEIEGSETLCSSEMLVVERSRRGPLHADGEEFEGERKFKVELIQKSLNLCVP